MAFQVSDRDIEIYLIICNYYMLFLSMEKLHHYLSNSLLMDI